MYETVSIKSEYSCLDNVCVECDSSTCSCVSDYTISEWNINDTSRALSSCSFVTSLYSQHTKTQSTDTGKKTSDDLCSFTSNDLNVVVSSSKRPSVVSDNDTFMLNSSYNLRDDSHVSDSSSVESTLGVLTHISNQLVNDSENISLPNDKEESEPGSSLQHSQ